MRRIGGKFHTDGTQIIKTSNGEPIPEEEPCFLLRARDWLALPLLLQYRAAAVADHCNDYQLDGIDAAIREFKHFSREHSERLKQPGITRGR